MSSFTVDATSLESVRNILNELHEHLTALPGEITQYGGVLGGRGLETDLAEFSGAWRGDVNLIDKHVTDLSARLLTAANAYKEIDKRVQNGSKGGGNQGAPVKQPIKTPPTGGTIKVSDTFLTSDQEVFVGDLAALTGLNPRVVAAWVLAEESSSAAEHRQAENNNNWLNIGYFDSGRGSISFSSVFDNPATAAEYTAKFLEGSWGGASSSIQAILNSKGEGPQAQINAIWQSDWATSHYDGGSVLDSTYGEMSGIQVTHT